MQTISPMFRPLLFSFVLCISSGGVLAKDATHTFKKLQLTDQFWAEGATFGDFNHDGKIDVVSGPFWYEGPDFKKRHEFAPANATFKRKKPDGTEETIPGFEGGLSTNNAYSECFLMFTYDFNGDGWTDIVVVNSLSSSNSKVSVLLNDGNWLI